MSRIIKSPFAVTNKSEKKLIHVRRIIEKEQLDIDEPNHLDNEAKLESFQEEADLILKRATDEAMFIKQQAEEEYKQHKLRIEQEEMKLQEQAEATLHRANEDGYRSGYQQGLEQGLKEYESAIEQIHSLIGSARLDYFDRLEQAEPVIIEIAIKVAEKITDSLLNDNREQWIEVVKKAINEVKEHEDVKLFVHPNWYEITLRQKEEIQLLLHRTQNLVIYPDPTLDEYGCTIETPYGQVEASITSQLTEIKEKLVEKLREDSNDHQ